MTPAVSAYFRSLADVLLQVEATDASGAPLSLEQGLTGAVRLVTRQTAAGRKIIFIGNGGSAAAASHLAVDYWKNGGMRALAFNDASLLTCISNDFGYPQVFEKPIEMFADAGDVLIAISSSGRSENVHRGVAAARARQCQVVTLSGFAPDNPLRRLGDLNFFVPAHTYGPVEIAHLAVCHAIVDYITDEQARLRGTSTPSPS